MYRFALRTRPKILLTAVFFSPIIRAEDRERHRREKSLEHPERPATLQSAGHRWVHSYRGLMWFENSPLNPGTRVFKPLPKQANSNWPLAISKWRKQPLVISYWPLALGFSTKWVPRHREAVKRQIGFHATARQSSARSVSTLPRGGSGADPSPSVSPRLDLGIQDDVSLRWAVWGGLLFLESGLLFFRTDLLSRLVSLYGLIRSSREQRRNS
jgi:hypothetical protein